MTNASTPISLPTEPPRAVVFNMGTLARVEKAFDKSLMTICQELMAMVPSAADGQKPTADQIAAASGRFRLSSINTLLAGCLGVSEDEVGILVPMDKVVEVFGVCLNGLITAVNGLAPAEEPPEGKATPAA